MSVPHIPKEIEVDRQNQYLAFFSRKYRITEKETFRMQTFSIEAIVKMQPKGVNTIPKKFATQSALRRVCTFV